MSLIVYIPQRYKPGRRLQKMVGHLNWQDTIEIFYTLKRFLSRLRQPNGDEDIAVIMASSTKELDELVVNKDLLSSCRLILILQDDKEKTIAKGHLLRPRFLSYRDQDFTALSSVLQKMKMTASPQPHIYSCGVLAQRDGV
jgi:hypothetical protein